MLRVIPVTLVALLMVLPFKLTPLVEALPAIAQTHDREFGTHDRPWAADLAAPKPGGGEDAAAPTAAPAALPAAELPPIATCTDPTVLAAVAEQADELAMRSRRLEDAEAMLGATETRVGVQIARLAEIKGEVEGLLARRSALEEEDVRRMVAIYEAMKPKDAARIFSDLETDMVIDVLDRMPERRSAPIIAEMKDEKAREVTRTILQRRSLASRE
ncbi:MotE family protein [Arenibaculum sp.]|uniref:MotE family protein n=1 Tax=Arenibaculum sp. TaxID=2865862 RepID=UPI002E0F37B4|nr:flagellar motor switch protein [Arenibaculum sp.]